jgi:hypothetical protein
MKYAIIFWGNSSDSKKVFTFQKKIVNLFLRVEVLPLPFEYILINFITDNEEHF